jgi:hypothetical protein
MVAESESALMLNTAAFFALPESFVTGAGLKEMPRLLRRARRASHLTGILPQPPTVDLPGN